eukprot:XP_001701065.1 predicted protein [Chlamydomonas reinhardtii]
MEPHGNANVGVLGPQPTGLLGQPGTRPGSGPDRPGPPLPMGTLSSSSQGPGSSSPRALDDDSAAEWETPAGQPWRCSASGAQPQPEQLEAASPASPAGQRGSACEKVVRQLFSPDVSHAEPSPSQTPAAALEYSWPQPGADAVQRRATSTPRTSQHHQLHQLPRRPQSQPRSLRHCAQGPKAVAPLRDAQELLCMAGHADDPSRIWTTDVVQHMSRFLPHNDLPATLRLVNRTLAQQLKQPQHTTIRLSHACPTHAFERHWAAPGATAGLRLHDRRRLLRLTARSDVIENLDIAIAAADCCLAVEGCTSDKAAAAAAKHGHRAVLDRLLGRTAAEGGAVLPASPPPGRVDVGALLEGAARGMPLAVLQQLHTEHSLWQQHMWRPLPQPMRSPETQRGLLNARGGDWRERFEYLRSAGYPLNAPEAVRRAASAGHEAALQYLLATQEGRWLVRGMRGAQPRRSDGGAARPPNGGEEAGWEDEDVGWLGLGPGNGEEDEDDNGPGHRGAAASRAGALHAVSRAARAAARGGHIGVLRVLAAHGLDLQQVPLLLPAAVRKRQLECAAWLLEHVFGLPSPSASSSGSSPGDTNTGKYTGRGGINCAMGSARGAASVGDIEAGKLVMDASAAVEACLESTSAKPRTSPVPQSGTALTTAAVVPSRNQPLPPGLLTRTLLLSAAGSGCPRMVAFVHERLRSEPAQPPVWPHVQSHGEGNGAAGSADAADKAGAAPGGPLAAPNVQAQSVSAPGGAAGEGGVPAGVPEALASAAATGHTAAVEAAEVVAPSPEADTEGHKEPQPTWDEASFGAGAAWAAAAKAGCVQVLELLASYGCPMGAFAFSARFLYLPPFAQTNGDPYVAAARNGDLATLRCLRRLGCSWGPPVPPQPQHDSDDSFTFSIGSTVFARAVTATARREWSSLPVLQLLLDLGCPVDWDEAASRARDFRGSKPETFLCTHRVGCVEYSD